MSPPMRYLEIADDLRRRLDSGEFPVGSAIPGGYVALRERYETAQSVLREALGILEIEGRIKPIRGTGLVVLDRQQLQRIDRGRVVYRDDLGYYFNRVSGHWSPVKTPTRSWGPAPADVAELLGVAATEEVLIRYRVLGPDPTTPLQIAVSYLPPDVARGTVLAEAHTGPGGIYDRLEEPEMSHGPLSWHEDVSTRMPEREEASALKISRNIPLLVITRTAESGTRAGKVVEVNQTVMSGAKFKVGYDIERDETAAWPVAPAAAENPPKA
jgi:GntR family transcriptional regulator